MNDNKELGQELDLEELERIAEVSHMAMQGVYNLGEAATVEPLLYVPCVAGKLLEQTLSFAVINDEKSIDEVKEFLMNLSNDVMYEIERLAEENKKAP